MSSTLVFPFGTQSEAVGKNTSTSASPGNTGPSPIPFYVTTATGIRVLTWDGFLTPDSWLKHASEPYADPTNAVDGARHAGRAVADPLTSLGAVGPCLPFLDLLKAGGSPANAFTPIISNLIGIPDALASTYIAADWKDAGGFDTEPNDQTLLGNLKRRLDAVMLEAPGALIGAVPLLCGQSEAADVSSATSLTFQTDLGAVMDSINAYVTLRGYAWAKSSCHFIVPSLPVAVGGAPLSWPWVTNVNNAIAALASGRSDTKSVVANYPGTYIHWDSVDNINIAAAMANAWLAAV